MKKLTIPILALGILAARENAVLGNAASGSLAAELRTEVTDTNFVRLNFRGAPLEQMLERLAEAAGFTLVLEAHPAGTADLWSAQPVTRDEALKLVDSVLLKNGYAALRKGGTLTIVNRDEVKTRSIPVRLGADPASMPDTDEVVTQIIPVRFTEVAQLRKDLQGLVSTRAVMTADESANAIVITDTQSSIRRVAQVIQAIDQGAEDATVVRVFRLKNADPSETADLLSQLFPDTSSTQSDQNAPQFGGGMGGPPGGGPGFGGPGGPGGMDFSAGGSGSSSGGSQRLKKGAHVLAVADSRTGSLVVSAPEALIEQIGGIISRLDESPARKQTVRVYQLQSGSPQQVAKVLRTLFQKDGTTASAVNSSSSTQTDPLETRSTTQTQNQQSSTRTGFGGSGSGSGGFGGAGGFSGSGGQ